MVTFACERCGADVEVAVKRNHRYCAPCRTALLTEKKRSEHSKRRTVRNEMHAASNWAELEVSRILGLDPPGERTHCQGCGARLPGRVRAQGPARRWCSEACRMRIARRGCEDSGSGYFGALLEDPCVYCGERGKLTLDHVDPASRGGADGWSNFVGACQECNSQKRDAPLLRYLLARPLYAQIVRAKADLDSLRLAA